MHFYPLHTISEVSFFGVLGLSFALKCCLKLWKSVSQLYAHNLKERGHTHSCDLQSLFPSRSHPQEEAVKNLPANPEAEEQKWRRESSSAPLDSLQHVSLLPDYCKDQDNDRRQDGRLASFC
jgi:hypothetical protein